VDEQPDDWDELTDEDMQFMEDIGETESDARFLWELARGDYHAAELGLDDDWDHFDLAEVAE